MVIEESDNRFGIKEGSGGSALGTHDNEGSIAQVAVRKWDMRSDVPKVVIPESEKVGPPVWYLCLLLKKINNSWISGLMRVFVINRHKVL